MTANSYPAREMTEEGLKRLGQILRDARENNNWSIKQFISVLKAKTGKTLSDSTVSGIERGNHEVKFGTLVLFAAVGHLPYTAHELMEIAFGADIDEKPKLTPVDIFEEMKRLIPALSKEEKKEAIKILAEAI